jgi:hypothetical protein
MNTETSWWAFIFVVVLIFILIFSVISVAWQRFAVLTVRTSRHEWDEESCVCCGSCLTCGGENGSCDGLCCPVVCPNPCTGGFINAGVTQQEATSTFLSQTALGNRLGVDSGAARGGSTRNKQQTPSQSKRLFKRDRNDRYTDLRPETCKRKAQMFIEKKRRLLKQQAESQQQLIEHAESTTRLLQQSLNAPPANVFVAPTESKNLTHRSLVIPLHYGDKKNNRSVLVSYALRSMLTKFLGLENNVLLMDGSNIPANWANSALAMQWLVGNAQRGQRLFFNFVGQSQSDSGKLNRIGENLETDLASINREFEKELMQNGLNGLNGQNGQNFQNQKGENETLEPMTREAGGLLSADSLAFGPTWLWRTLIRPLDKTGAFLLMVIDAGQSDNNLHMPFIYKSNESRSQVEFGRTTGIIEQEKVDVNVVVISGQLNKEATFEENGNQNEYQQGQLTCALVTALEEAGPTITWEKLILEAQRMLDTEGCNLDVCISSTKSLDLLSNIQFSIPLL